ncbi:MAG: NUDIX domain-containing protein, partial [Fibrobacter sp.]|nr:NUDIX domain-containing protein [Fibrobacter sp.]
MTSFSYSPEIAEETRAAVTESELFQNWFRKANREFKIAKIHFSSVDFRHKSNAPLFIKLSAEASLPDGRPVNGIVLLRGNAVGVLVVLRCEGKPYLLLVEQPRFPIASVRSLEIPAGILDWSADYRKVALEELKEEAQIRAEDSELIDLSGFWHENRAPGFAASCGLLDEFVRLYAIERTVTPEELQKFHDRKQQYQEENEWIRT